MEHEFTKEIDQVKAFLQSFKAESLEYHPDWPEDVQGALKLCLMQDWTEESVKRVVLICDAPQHGMYYDKNEVGGVDNSPLGDTKLPTVQSCIKEFKKNNINLQVIQLHSSMKKMVDDIKKWLTEVDLVNFVPIL